MIVPLAATFSAQICLFHADEAIVKAANTLVDLFRQSRGVQNRRAGFHGIFIPVFFYSVSITNPGCKPLSGGSRAQNIPPRPAYAAGSAGYITLGNF